MKKSNSVDEEALWEALVSRSSALDDRWLYGVRTTGIFCRLSCGSRRPRRENVVFFDDVNSAEENGFRPCKRCKPCDGSGEPLEQACTLLASMDESADTREVARAIGLSPSYFHRWFKKRLGVTPQQYRRRIQAERAHRSLSHSASVTETIYEAGYSSSSRFYDQLSPELGMPPSVARAGGPGERVHHAARRCSLGFLLIAWTASGVCHVAFGDTVTPLVDALAARFPKAELHAEAEGDWVEAVLELVEHPADSSDTIPLDIRGTAFQARVWKVLRQIPVGETRTYSDIAQALGQPSAARAVAGSCAANGIAVLIPCHRVVRSDGSLSGYRWGRERKRALLQREASTDES